MNNMSHNSDNETLRRDEALLIDVLLGQADEAGRDYIARKLAEDPEFRRRNENAAHALSALQLLPVRAHTRCGRPPPLRRPFQIARTLRRSERLDQHVETNGQ